MSNQIRGSQSPVRRDEPIANGNPEINGYEVKDLSGKGNEENKETGHNKYRSRSPSQRSDKRRDNHINNSKSRGASSSRNPEKLKTERTTIYVAGISRKVTADDLREPFEKFGPVKEIIMKNRYSFIEYENIKDAKDAVQAMNGKPFQGYDLRVELTCKNNFHM